MNKGFFPIQFEIFQPIDNQAKNDEQFQCPVPSTDYEHP